jgi:hypothetical protein
MNARWLALSVVVMARAGLASADWLPPAPAVLPDEAAVRSWAEKSSFGGNQVEVLTAGKRQVIATRRSFTSGVPSCALTVFVPVAKGWSPGLTLGDVWNGWLVLEQKGDLVRVVDARDKGEVARFSIAALSRAARRALKD